MNLPVATDWSKRAAVQRARVRGLADTHSIVAPLAGPFEADCSEKLLDCQSCWKILSKSALPP